MGDLVRSLSAAIVVALFLAAPGSAAEKAEGHRIAIQVDQNDPDVMNLALNNAKNVFEHYDAKGEKVSVEIVAYGPGLHMLRLDTSPVKDRIKEMAGQFSSRIKFDACNNTKQAMEKREGKPVPIITEATVVPSGVVQLMELQEQGWSYVRP
jgi:intracellular sulfur oxidation DsrE/DsrF family protein